MRAIYKKGKLVIVKLGSRTLATIQSSFKIVQIEPFANSSDYVILEYVEESEGKEIDQEKEGN